MLYIDDFQQNVVLIYSVDDAPRLIGEIQGLDGPGQMAVDRFSTLYIANTFANDVVVFKPFL